MVTAFAIFVGLILLYATLSNHIMFYYVVSRSMEPSIPVGSLVTVVPDKFLHEGDVVAFRRGSATILHRVAEIHENYLLLSADASPNYREIVTVDMVVGKAIFAVPLLGYVHMVLATPVGLSLALTIALLTFFLKGDGNIGFWPSAITTIFMVMVTLRGLDFTHAVAAITLTVSALSLATFLEDQFPNGRSWAEPTYVTVLITSALLIAFSDLRWILT